MQVELVTLTPGHELRAAVLALRPLPEQEQYSSHAAETLPAADANMACTPFAIVHDGRAVGFGVLDRGGVLAELTIRPERSVLLRSFYINAAEQGRGLGRAAAMALPALAAIATPDARAMFLTVNVANPAAARTYVSAGFVDTGRRYLGGPVGSQYVLKLDLVAARRRGLNPK